MQQISVHGIRRLAFALVIDRYVSLPAVLQQLVSGIQVPLPPGSDHLDVGIERIGTQFEAHLVVALAGGAVSDCVRTGLLGNLYQALGNQRAGNAGAEQVFPFIERICAEHGKHEFAREFLLEILDMDFLHAQRLRLGPRRLDLLPLADVGGKGNHLGAVVVLQPPADHRRVQPPGIRQDYLGSLHYLESRAPAASVNPKAGRTMSAWIRRNLMSATLSRKPIAVGCYQTPPGDGLSRGISL